VRGHLVGQYDGAIFALKWNPSISQLEGEEGEREGGRDGEANLLSRDYEGEGGREGGREGGTDNFTDQFLLSIIISTGDVRGEWKLRPEHGGLEHADRAGREEWREGEKEWVYLYQVV